MTQHSTAINSDNKPAISTASLDRMRERIDYLDEKIFEMLKERAEVARDVGRYKSENNLPSLKPSREALMLRDILAKETPLEKATVLALWREIISACTSIQCDLKSVFYAPERQSDLWDDARDYLGQSVPLVRTASVNAAIKSAYDDPDTISILPWPDELEDRIWWGFLLSDMENCPKIFARVPYSRTVADAKANMGLCIGQAPFEDTGNDRTILVIETSEPISRARLTDVAIECGWEPTRLFWHSPLTPQAHALHLMEIDRYMSATDDTLTSFCEILGEDVIRCQIIGGYAVID